MKIKVVYKTPSGETSSHQLKSSPVDEEATLILARRIAMEGFFIDDGDVGYYIAPSQVVQVVIVRKGSGVVGGTGMSNV